MVEQNSRKIIARLLREGWIKRESKSGHTILCRDGRHITVPHPRKDLPIGTARDIARKAGWL